jgi:hypothetical protein
MIMTRYLSRYSDGESERFRMPLLCITRRAGGRAAGVFQPGNPTAGEAMEILQIRSPWLSCDYLLGA